MQPLSDSQRAEMEEAVTRYSASVTAREAQYLADRGLTRETALTFRLGVVADPLPGHERYQGMLVIPYLHREGYPLTMRFRNLSGEGPKYLSLPHDIARVFNTKAIFDAGDEIHVCEGEFDAMVLTQAGLPAVAFPGASTWRSKHRRMLGGFSKVWVWGDADEAGAEFANKVTRSMRTATKVRLPQGMDVTDYYLTNGRDAEALRSLYSKEASAA